MKKFAFTLAEVLITLGIIGVVAAITIPGLVFNAQKAGWVARLKETVAIVNQAHKLIMAEEDVTEMGETGIHFSRDKKRCDINCRSCDGNIWGNLNCCGYHIYTKYLKVLQVRGIKGRENFKGTYLNSNKIVNIKDVYMKDRMLCYILINGSEVCFNAATSTMTNHTFGKATEEEVLIDVNTNAVGPNKIGRDIFVFYTAPDGHLIPQGSAEFAQSVYENKGKSKEEALSSTYYWRNATATSNNGCRKNNYTGTGKGCTGRVLEEGKMNY